MSCYWSWEYITTYNTLKGGLNLAAEFLNCSFESTYVNFMDKILKPGEHDILHGREYSKNYLPERKIEN